MKTLLALFSLFFTCIMVRAQDLAHPTPNLQVLPGGSYIIAMDNTMQLNGNTDPSKRFFNLRSYGLVVYLLDNNIKIKRVIRSGKAKDEIDFSAFTILIHPYKDAVPQKRSFKAGPFIIMASDIYNIDIDRLIENYNNNVGGVSGILSSIDQVKVYKTMAAVSDVDIRHDLSGFVPKACILNDGGYADIHHAFMNLAGIPSTNYSVTDNTNLSIRCFSFASEPHNGNPGTTNVQNIQTFIQGGGNFLAECDAINSYETKARFHSNNGISISNAAISNVNYPNADIPYSQFEGSYNPKLGGSVQNWLFPPGSSYMNNGCSVVTGNSSINIGASVAKLTPPGQPGGLVFYLGNHNFLNTSNYNEINGIRMYMNAFLTPANTSSMLSYKYALNCSDNSLTLTANSGPSSSYPIKFTLYSDDGNQKGVIDAEDHLIGSSTVISSGSTGKLNFSKKYSTQQLLLQINPSFGCYPPVLATPNMCSFSVLPVNFTSFDAIRQNNKVILNWAIVNEEGGNGYLIKRRTADADWESITFIPVIASNIGKYQFADINSTDSRSEYQVIEVGNDGSQAYSVIRTVGPSFSKISIYPNPVQDNKLFIDFNGNDLRKITIYNISGKKVRYIESSVSHLIITDLQKGMYSVTVNSQDDTFLVSERFLVL